MVCNWPPSLRAVDVNFSAPACKRSQSQHTTTARGDDSPFPKADPHPDLLVRFRIRVNNLASPEIAPPISTNTVPRENQRFKVLVGTVSVSRYTTPASSSASRPECNMVEVLALFGSPSRNTMGSVRRLAPAVSFADFSFWSAWLRSASISVSTDALAPMPDSVVSLVNLRWNHKNTPAPAKPISAKPPRTSHRVVPCR